MKKDSTGVKLGIAFGFLISLLIGVGWLGLSRLGQANSNLNEIFNQRWAKVALARQATFYSNANYRMIMQAVLMKHFEKAETELLQTRREENVQKVAANQNKIEELLDSAKERELLNKVNEAKVPANKSLNSVIDQLIL